MNSSAVTSIDAEFSYDTEGGSQVTLSPQIVRQYLVNGQGNVSDSEVMMFLQLCKYQGLNPFLKEAYLIKFGNGPASIVVGKEVFTKRAERHPEYHGMEAGIYVLTKDGEIVERKGTIYLPTERLIGGWARVFRKGYNLPVEMTVSFEEYVGRKFDGTPNQQWATKPATMIRKVAVVQALRETFPSEFGGMYSQEEVNDQVEQPIPVSQEQDVPKEPAAPSAFQNQATSIRDKMMAKAAGQSPASSAAPTPPPTPEVEPEPAPETPAEAPPVEIDEYAEAKEIWLRLAGNLNEFEAFRESKNASPKNLVNTLKRKEAKQLQQA